VPGYAQWSWRQRERAVVLFGSFMAVGVYGPALLVVSLVAWPAMDDVSGLDGYLVNCCAYQSRPPDRGDWVWLRSSYPSHLQVGRVVAGAGEEVAWAQQQLRIQGTPASGMPFRSSLPPKELVFVVPEGHLLVDTDSGPRRRMAAEGLVLVPREQVGGRAWARMYPLWERQLLH